ncbi:MAG: KH domain-containing protein [Clostridia bacterium]|nr:KH domain-containing protein [Clostridia bacterium]
MQELVSYIVESLTGNSDFSVEISEEERLITITLSPDDIGRVIGRGGKTAKAIRLIVKAAAAKRNKRYDVEIREINEAGDSENN